MTKISTKDEKTISFLLIAHFFLTYNILKAFQVLFIFWQKLINKKRYKSYFWSFEGKYYYHRHFPWYTYNNWHLVWQNYGAFVQVGLWLWTRYNERIKVVHSPPENRDFTHDYWHNYCHLLDLIGVKTRHFSRNNRK